MAGHGKRRKIRNPFTGRMILANGQTAKNMRKGESSLKLESKKYRKNEGKYKNLPENVFCGPEGNAGPGTFPVNSQKRCRAALAYSKRAPNPNGIVRCAIRKAKQHHWNCGQNSSQVKKLRITPANKNINQRRHNGGARYVNVPKHGKRKVHRSKKGKHYVIVNGRKRYLSKSHRGGATHQTGEERHSIL